MSSEFTASQLAVIKYASNAEKDCITGYLRRLSKICNLYNIPELVISVCLAFYINIDYFKYQDEEHEFHFSDNNSTITKIKDFWDACYVDIVEGLGWSSLRFGEFAVDSIKSLIVTWTIKINKCIEYSKGINIGICPTNVEDVDLQYDHYGLFNSGNLSCAKKPHLSDDEVLPSLFNQKKKAKKFGENDVLLWILDLHKQQVRYKVNDGDIQILFDQIKQNHDIKYRFYARIWFIHDSISILSTSVLRT